MKITKLLAFAGLVAAASSASAQTGPIVGQYNTGSTVNVGAPVIGSTGQQGVNYKVTGPATTPLTACPAGFGGGNCAFIAGDGAYPLQSNWLPNSASTVSKWITPTANQGATFDTVVNGLYTYTLSFNLTGFFPNTASLAGRFLTDNTGTVALNGNLLPAVSNSFTAWTPFSVSTGFVSGINTLTFGVTNLATPLQNPTGLRVEFTSSQVTAVPEPSALLLSLAGLAMVGGLAKRRLSARA